MYMPTPGLPGGMGPYGEAPRASDAAMSTGLVKPSGAAAGGFVEPACAGSATPQMRARQPLWTGVPYWLQSPVAFSTWMPTTVTGRVAYGAALAPMAKIQPTAQLPPLSYDTSTGRPGENTPRPWNGMPTQSGLPTMHHVVGGQLGGAGAALWREVLSVVGKVVLAERHLTDTQRVSRCSCCCVTRRLGIDGHAASTFPRLCAQYPWMVDVATVSTDDGACRQWR